MAPPGAAQRWTTPALSLAAMTFFASGAVLRSPSTAASQVSIAVMASSLKLTSPSSGVWPSQKTWFALVPCSRTRRSRTVNLR